MKTGVGLIGEEEEHKRGSGAVHFGGSGLWRVLSQAGHAVRTSRDTGGGPRGASAFVSCVRTTPRLDLRSPPQQLVAAHPLHEARTPTACSQAMLYIPARPSRLRPRCWLVCGRAGGGQHLRFQRGERHPPVQGGGRFRAGALHRGERRQHHQVSRCPPFRHRVNGLNHLVPSPPPPGLGGQRAWQTIDPVRLSLHGTFSV